MQACPLCSHSPTNLIHQDRRRNYWRCQRCDLIFVPSDQFIDAESEKAIYDLHDNNPQDLGYRQFLQRAIDPIKQRLVQGATALDFGCGPGPAIIQMVAEFGVSCFHYDKFYADDPSLLQQQYDIVFATEVVEHFTEPKASWDLLVSLVKADGALSIMTKRHLGNQRFANWHYKNDVTHVCFYSEATLAWLAEQYAMQVAFPAADVAVFSRA